MVTLNCPKKSNKLCKHFETFLMRSTRKNVAIDGSTAINVLDTNDLRYLKKSVILLFFRGRYLAKDQNEQITSQNAIIIDAQTVSHGKHVDALRTVIFLHPVFTKDPLSFCQFTWNNSMCPSLQSGLQHLPSAGLERSKGSTSCVHWCHQRYSDAPLHSPLFDVPLRHVCVPVSFNPPCAWLALTADERQSIDRSVSLSLSPSLWPRLPLLILPCKDEVHSGDGLHTTPNSTIQVRYTQCTYWLLCCVAELSSSSLEANVWFTWRGCEKVDGLSGIF